jgi:hypothetical protein
MALDFQPMEEPSGSSSQSKIDFQPMDFQEMPTSVEDGYKEMWKKAKEELHGIEDATNRFAGGALGFIGAGIPTAAHRLNEHIQGRGNIGSFGEDFDTLSNKISNSLIPSNANQPPESADKYNDAISEAVNRYLIPMAGIHTPHIPQRTPKIPDISKSDKIKALEKLDVPVEAKPLDFQPMEQMELPLENTPQQVAEMQARGTGQRDLFAPENADVGKAEIAPPIGPQVDALRAQEAAASEAKAAEWRNAQQMEMPDEAMAIAPQYGIHEGMGRVDENGMPIRADRSMEVQNLENPLQRNLWGDELPRQAEQEAPRGITNDIDRMPAGEARQVGVDMLSNGIRSDGPYSRQRGAINLDVFDPAFRAYKALEDGVKLLMKGTREGPVVIAVDASGKRIGETQFNHDTFARGPRETDNLEAGWVTTDPKKMSNMGTDADRLAPTTPASRKGIAAEMYKFAAEQGNDIVRSGAQTPEGKAMWNKFEQKGLASNGKIMGPRNQRGSAPIINDMAKTIETFKDTLEAVGKIGLHHMTSKEDYLSKNIPGMKESLSSRIPDAPKAADIVKKAMEPDVKDIPPQGVVSRNIQSGLQQMSTKYRDNPVLLGAGRILDNMYTKSALQIREVVKPVLQHLQMLNSKDRMELTQLWTKEMFDKKQYTKQQMLDAGFSKKQVEAYDMFRAAQNAMYDANNAGRALLGKDPITKENAYLASMRYGDWQFSVLDKQGKAAWFVRSTTKAEALAAIDHLKKNFGDSLQLDKVAPEFRKDSATYHPDTPRDVMGAYQDMLRYFSDNPALTDNIRESMRGFTEQKGYDFLAHKQRFLNKNNVRGFEGDKPWLSPEANSKALLKAQENYMKNSIGWNHAQEAMANIKELMSSPELAQRMPNALDMVQKVFDSQFGVSGSVVSAVESTIAQMLPGYSNGKLAWGRSSSSLYHGSSGVKTALYLQLLGLNLTHMIATPIQGMITAPANHAYLTGRGFEHNVFKTTMAAIGDFAGGMMKHSLHDISGKDLDVPMTALGKRALKFAEDNGVIDKNLFNESVDLNNGPVANTAKTVLGYTIAMPEKVTRLGTFMSLVHHLDASGKLSEMEVFQKAKEFTDNSLTGFSKQDRPMVVNKAGAAGSLAYTFKSYLFNYYNQLSTHARMAGEGNPKPLMYNLGMLAAVGGVLSVPMVNEADGAWNLFKEFIATHAPEHYNLVKGRGVKEQIITHLPDIASYGAASELTGIGMQNKFGTDIADPERPFKNLFPMSQDIKELVSGVGALAHPNKTSLTEAAYQQLPRLAQGQMEYQMDAFKGPKQKGGQIAYNPNSLMEQNPIDHLRSESDWNKRALGMTSLAEAKDKQTGFSNKMEDMRMKQAIDTLGSHIYDAAVTRKNPEDAKAEIIAYLQLNPDGNALKADFAKRVNNAVLTPSQRQLIAAKTFNQIDSVLRLMGTRGQRNAN